jgi:hypothetical protein
MRKLNLDTASRLLRQQKNTMTAESRVRHFLHRLARLVRGDDGFALVAALGFLVVTGITTAIAITYTTQHQGSVNYAKSEQLSQSYAEAALARAYATLYAASDPTLGTAVPETTVTFEKGTGTYSGALDASAWTLVGVGRVANPNHGSDIVRIVRGRTTLGSGRRSSANNAVWNYIFVDDTTSCTTVGNNVTIAVPLYLRGNLCLQQQASISAAAYGIQITGYVQFENSSHIGGAGTGERLHEAHIGAGCRVGTTGAFTSCGDGTRVYTEVPTDTNVPVLTKPPVDLAYWYANAQPGPMHNCTEGSFPGGFDTDTVMNRSRPAVDLTPNTAYDCKIRDAAGNLIGRIAWTPGDPGTLTILGTIFFDGDIVFKNLTRAVYQGRATIYSSGKITLGNQTMLCGVSTCDSAWNPLQNLLAFVAGSSTDVNGFEAQQYARFQGAVYAVNDFAEGNNANLWGVVIARQLHLDNSTINYAPVGTLLPGMPATYEDVSVLVNEAGSWG